MPKPILPAQAARGRGHRPDTHGPSRVHGWQRTYGPHAEEIVCAETSYPGGGLVGVPVAEWAAVLFPGKHQVGKRPKKTSEVAAAYAEVNHGRWIVKCPFCRSAQLGSVTDARYFCGGAGGCLNQQADGEFIAVQWPPPGQRQQIEALLLVRPDPSTRNWTPGETIGDLQAENKAMGV